MRTLLSAFSTELAADGHSGLALCCEIGLATPIFRTTWSRSITFDGDTYAPDVLVFGEVGGALRPTSPTMTLTIQNLKDPVTDSERPWSTTLNAEDVNGVEVSVRAVMISQLAQTTAQIDETGWVVRAASLSGNFAHLELGPPYDLARLRVPAMSLRAPWCAHEFKDRLCKSESANLKCAKGFKDCLANHPQLALRFSQYPFDTDMRRTG